MRGLRLPDPKPAKTAKALAKQGDNAGAAAIILADPERYGGEGAAVVRWARLYVARKEREECTRF